MIKNLFLLCCLLALSAPAFTQGTFYSNDYSSNAGWTPIGNNVEIVHGRVELQIDCLEEVQRRVFTQLPAPLISENTPDSPQSGP